MKAITLVGFCRHLVYFRAKAHISLASFASYYHALKDGGTFLHWFVDLMVQETRLHEEISSLDNLGRYGKKLNQAFYSSSFDKDIVITVGSYIQQHRQQFDKSITNNRGQNAYDYFLMNEDRILQYYNYKYKVVDKIVVKDN